MFNKTIIINVYTFTVPYEVKRDTLVIVFTKMFMASETLFADFLTAK
jgi:DNA anti-recombination protein RmuC